MEVSYEYQQMCQKATKLQQLKKEECYQVGDLLYHNNTLKTVVAVNGELFATLSYDEAHTIVPVWLNVNLEIITWIPYQRQLQTILLDHYNFNKMTSPLVLLLRQFTTFVRDNELMYPSSSYEQYWMRMLMLKKFKEAWNVRTYMWVKL